MISVYSNFSKRLQIILDLGITALALVLTYYLRSELFGILYPGTSPLSRYLWLLPLVLPLWGVIFNYYSDHLTYDRTLQQISWCLLKACIAGILILILILYVTQSYRLNRTLVFVFLPLNYLMLVLEKGIMKFIMRPRLKDLKSYYRQVLIIGTGKRAQTFVKRVKRNKNWRIRITGFIDKDESLLGKEIHGIKVVGLLKDIGTLIREKGLDEIFFVVGCYK